MDPYRLNSYLTLKKECRKKEKGKGNRDHKNRSLREIFNRFFVRIPYPAQPERGVTFPLPGLLTESGMS